VGAGSPPGKYWYTISATLPEGGQMGGGSQGGQFPTGDGSRGGTATCRLTKFAGPCPITRNDKVTKYYGLERLQNRVCKPAGENKKSSCKRREIGQGSWIWGRSVKYPSAASSMEGPRDCSKRPSLFPKVGCSCWTAVRCSLFCRGTLLGLSDTLKLT